MSTDGTRNACSFLIGKATRIAFAMGFARVGSYVLEHEPGHSYSGAGWTCKGKAGGSSWKGRKNRPNRTDRNFGLKWLWEVTNPAACDGWREHLCTLVQQSDDTGQLSLIDDNKEADDG